MRINNIKISAINVYFRPSHSLRAHHVVPSVISSTKVYVIRVKPVLTGLLSALASQWSRFSANIGRWAPSYCAVGWMINRHVLCVTYGFDSHRIDSRRRVVGSLEPWCRLSANFVRERRTPPCCAVSRLILYMYVYVHVYVYVTLFLPAFCRITRAGKAEFLPISAGDDTMLCRRPFQQPANTCCRRRRLSSVVSVEGPRGRRNWLSANFSRERRTPPCCTNVYNVQHCTYCRRSQLLSTRERCRPPRAGVHPHTNAILLGNVKMLCYLLTYSSPKQ